MVGARHRTLAYIAGEGGTAKAINPSLSDQVFSPPVLTKVMDDTTMKGPPFNIPHNLDLRTTGAPIARFSGKNGNWDVKNAPVYPSGFINPAAPTDWPSQADAITRALAVSNPNRPIVDPGMVAQDIWEFPKLLHDIVGFAVGAIRQPTSVMRRLGKNYLGYEFGVAPTIDDLKNALNVMDSVNKRLDVIRALKTKGLHRTTRLGNHGGGKGSKNSKSNPPFYAGVPQTHTDYYLSLFGPVPAYTATYEYRAALYVSTTFKLMDDSWIWNPDTSPLSGARAFLGAEPNTMAEIWELTPWSWMIDWFTNAGDVFTASRNSLGTTCTEACFMGHSWVEVTDLHTSDSAGWTDISIDRPYTRFNEYINRRPVLNPSPSLSFHLPFLDGGQLSILAALTHSKFWNG
jgi:hypothetical protein